MRRLDAFRQTPHSFVDLRGRERAERQPKEPFAASFREEGQSVCKVEPSRGRLCSYGSREDAVRERQRDEEPTLRASRYGVRQVRVESSEARLETWGIQLLQALDLRKKQSSPTPFECDSLRKVPRGDVGVLRHLREGVDQAPLPDHEAGADAGSNELGKGAHVDRTIRPELVECGLLIPSIPQQSVRCGFDEQEAMSPRE